LAAALCLAVFWATGCGRNRPVHEWNEKVLATGRIHDDGELERAERGYLELIDSAPSRDARRFILMELAAISEDQGEWREAIGRYEKVYSQPVDDEPGALALYRTGLIVGDELGDSERGREIRRETITRFPKSVAAEFAVRDHADYYRKLGDFEAMTADFERLHAQVTGEAVGDNLLFAVAETFREEGLEAAALPYYRRVWTEYPEGHVADESLWEAAQIYERRQQWRRAIPLYSKLAEMVEDSWFVGTYNSTWANDARIRLGLIHMLYLNDYAQAARHFEQYLEDFPDGLMSDDVAWHLVQLRRLQDGEAAFRESMKAFAEEYPESRYVREVERRLSEEAGP
jgi:tetratricopeptide (TPR) repeat protein